MSIQNQSMSPDESRHHDLFHNKPRLRVAITGASGLIGKALRELLQQFGHTVVPLVRTRSAQSTGIFWEPETQTMDAAALEGFDVVVHLAGENVAGGRWTKAQKQRILRSRTLGTRLISDTLARCAKPPKALLAASAIGYYGPCSPASLVTEESPTGTGFLAEVCRSWEAETEVARQAGIRVVNMRIGVVLTATGGALPKMLVPFSLGLGGKIGDGQQGMSWISLDDTLGAIYFLMFHDEISGSVNLTAPQPCSQGEFAKTLGRILRRPTWIPMPAWVVKTLFGQMGQEVLLEGAYILPQRLLQSGFVFEQPALEMALRQTLGRPVQG